MRYPAVHLWCSRIFGGILGVSSVLKLIALVVGDLHGVAIDLPVYLTALLAIVEGVTAWLLVRHSSVPAVVALGVLGYGALTAVAALLWLLGYEDCGCMGSFSAVPSAMFFIDAVGFATLLWTGSLRATVKGVREIAGYIVAFFRPEKVGWRPTIVACLCATATMIVLLGTEGGRAIAGFPAISRLIAPQVDLGVGEPGTRVDSEIKIISRSSEYAKVIGMTPSCGCIALGKRIVGISPKCEVTMPFGFVRPSNPGRFMKEITLYLEHAEQHAVTAVIVGESASY